jgi:hypothetical protein
MTASHGPARVGKRTAHRDRSSTPPAPVDDRGRRRDRSSGFIGFRFAGAVRGGAEAILCLTAGRAIYRWPWALASHRRPLGISSTHFFRL